MQFLVVGRYTEPGPLVSPDQLVPFVEGRVVPSLELLADWEEKEGKIKAGGVYAGQRAAAFIVEASSAEEIGRLMSSIPFWHDLTWDVTPLQSFRSTAERERGVVEQAKAAAQ